MDKNKINNMKEITMKFAIVPDVPNKNGHIYPKKIVKNVVEQLKEDLKNKEVYGTLGYPFELGILDHNAASAFKLNDIDYNDGVTTGKMEILDTPNGKLFNDIIGPDGELDDKYRIGCSFQGNVGPDGIIENAELLSVSICLKNEIEYGK